jgi:hypothetical protein
MCSHLHHFSHKEKQELCICLLYLGFVWKKEAALVYQRNYLLFLRGL